MAAQDETGSLRQAADLVSADLQLLDPFAHRNKNQHRRAKWWAEFGILRRGLHRLDEELRAALDDSRARRRGGKKPAGDDNVGAAVRHRARWLLDALLPRAYLAFTQVVADGQFAVLGVFLLGVLSRVRTTVLSHLVQEQSASSDVSVAEQGNTKDLPSTPPKLTDLADLGVAVSREDVIRGDVEGGSHSAEPPAAQSAAGKDRGQTKRKAAKDGESMEKKPKKNKRKKGDEFDDLFSALV